MINTSDNNLEKKNDLKEYLKKSCGLTSGNLSHKLMSDPA